ncbi:MAG TPA: phosphoglycerate kinase [bacterium]|nr:phosphoglycerate kinase [bacterium]HQL62647.1 phosphoglycerate kinase [bacterium]
MQKKTVRDVDFKGKRVLMRADFNVPLNENGEITDDTRIRATLPTIQYILEHGGRLAICSHLGRPKGAPDPKYSLKPVAKRLSELLGQEVKMLPDCVGDEVKKAVFSLKDGQVCLLENVRFHPGETENDPEHSKKLAELGEIFVNDAFGSAHREQCSVSGVTEFIKTSVAGFLMEKEIEFLVQAIENPDRPFLAIMGGAKISGKIDVIQNLLSKVDGILIGGAMAYTLLKAKGIPVGKSLVEDDRIDMAKDVLKAVEQKGIKFMLPLDHLVAPEVKEGAPVQVTQGVEIPDDRCGVDIGPQTIAAYRKEIAGAKTILWNGPMGVFEIPAFAKGTMAIAEALAESKAKTIIGGGDSVSAVNKAGVADKITHISTGGGASLELLEGKPLPGLVTLSDK